MSCEGEEYGGGEVLRNFMFRESSDKQGCQVALGQSILKVDQNSRAGSQAPLCEQGIQVSLSIRVDEQQEMAALFDIGVNPFFSGRA